VFDADDQFRGRVVPPEGHRVLAERDGAIWTVDVDDLGVQSLHRLPLLFEEGR
jgi:hypothetical protein